MFRRHASGPSRALPPLILGALLLLLVLAPAALAMPPIDDGPVKWLPASSTYGAGEKAFLEVPFPAPPGLGMTQGPLAVYGSGFWDGATAVYAMGFVGGQSMPTGGLPAMADTDLLLRVPIVTGSVRSEQLFGREIYLWLRRSSDRYVIYHLVEPYPF